MSDNYAQLHQKCWECGSKVTHIHYLGIDPDYNLLIKWSCENGHVCEGVYRLPGMLKSYWEKGDFKWQGTVN